MHSMTFQFSIFIDREGKGIHVLLEFSNERDLADYLTSNQPYFTRFENACFEWNRNRKNI